MTSSARSARIVYRLLLFEDLQAGRELDCGRRSCPGRVYLPLEYYDVLAASSEMAGPRGGVVLGADTIKRSVDNALFSALVRGSR